MHPKIQLISACMYTLHTEKTAKDYRLKQGFKTGTKFESLKNNFTNLLNMFFKQM